MTALTPELLRSLMQLRGQEQGPRHDTDTPQGVTGANASQQASEAFHRKNGGRSYTGPNPTGTAIRESLALKLGEGGSNRLYEAISSVLGDHYTIGRNAEGRRANRRVAQALRGNQGLNSDKLPIADADGRLGGGHGGHSGGTCKDCAGKKGGATLGNTHPALGGFGNHFEEMARRKEAENAARRQREMMERGMSIKNDRAATGAAQKQRLVELLTGLFR